jgi:hypothetical protein
MLDVPFAFKRVDAMLYIASFYLEVNQLRLSYATLEVLHVFLRKDNMIMLARDLPLACYSACVISVVWVGIPHGCLGLYCAQMTNDITFVVFPTFDYHVLMSESHFHCIHVGSLPGDEKQQVIPQSR